MGDLKLKAVVSVADKWSKNLRGMNKQLRGLQRPFKSLQGQMRQFDKLSGFKGLRSGVAGLTGQVARLGAVSLGAGTAGFIALDRMATSADKIQKLHDNFDITTDAIQEYNFMADRQGVSQATVTKSMQAFTKRLSEARNGTGELFGLLKEVNPEFLKQVLAIDNNTDAYGFMLKGMAALPDQQQQILLGDKAFSEAGRELVKITSQGADEMDNLARQAHIYGAVLSSDVLKQSAKFKDEMTNSTSIIKGLGFVIGGALMPEVTEIVKGFSDWYLANQQVINSDLISFAKESAISMKGFGHWLGDTLPKMGAFIDDIGGMKTVAIAMGLVIAGPLISAFATLSAVMLATPVGWFLGAAGLVVGVVGMITGAWNPLATFFPNLWDGIVNSVGKRIFQLIEMGKGITNFVGDAVDSVLGSTRQAAAQYNGGGQGGNATQDAARARPQRNSILPAAGQQRVGGQLDIKVSSEGRVSVSKIQSDNPDFELNVDSGLSMVGR